MKWSLLVLALALPACSKQDKEGLARIGRRIADKAASLSSSVQGKVPPDWRWPGSVERRVWQRLRFERSLADVKIGVTHLNQGIELTGKVTSDEQRRRAVELAESTVGVERVIETLQIVPE